MSKRLADENLIRRYLLGELPESERDEFEKRLLADPEFLEISRMIEGELLDNYVFLGRLSESDRMNLERSLLMSAQQQRRVQLIRLLHLKSNAGLFTRFFRPDRSGWNRLGWAA